MRKKFTFSILISIVIFYTFTNNIDNITNAKSWNNCGGCHSTSASTTVDSIKLIHPTTGALMTGFFPDSTYKIRMVASNTTGTGTYPNFGFQLRAINTSSAIVGNFTGTLPANTGVSSGFLTQSSTISSSGGKYIIEVNWQAPPSGTNTVNLQSVVNAVNSDGSPNGDAFSSSVKTLTYNVFGVITTLSCGSGTTTGTLTSGSAASSVSFSVPYTGGNGGAHSGQVVNSTGVTGLTATLSAGSFTTSTGNLVYTVTGTPTTSGTASFALNIGTKTCTYTITVTAPAGVISSLNCGSGTTTGTLTNGSAASGVSFSIPYTGGNTGTHSGQVVTSTGVTGLTATLAAGNFANGAGNLNYTLSGTPTSAGTANFALNIGGQSCSYSVNVNPIIGAISALNCTSGLTIGSLTNGTAASGVSFKIPYTGGNTGVHSGQVVNSTGVTGLTATLPSGSFVNGADSVTYTVSGTPTSAGTASFALNIGGKSCTYSINVSLPIGVITVLDCNNGTTSGTLASGIAASGVSFSIPYTGANAGTYSSQTINSTGVTGLTASLSSGVLANGAGNLTFTVSGTPGTSGTAVFPISVGGQSCNYSITVSAGIISTLNCASGTTTGSLIAGAAASGVSFSVPYTGGNGGGYSGQTVNSFGITGLTAILSSGAFNTGNGNVSYSVSGTPSGVGNAIFSLNIGGQNCTYTINVAPGAISTLDCNSATTSGTLTSGTAASSVSFTLPYTGGNGGSYSAQTVNSTGVTGLTANLGSSNFSNGNGTLTYFITGTPSTTGSADFFINIGGQSCLFSITVYPPVGVITGLNCANGTTIGTLNSGSLASGVSFSIPYTGGNKGTYGSQTINSTGVIGLTASLINGLFNTGNGNLSFTVSGVPTSSGTANFLLNIGGQTCTYSVNVNLQNGTITGLNCASGTTKGSLNANSTANGVSFTIPYTGGNGGLYSAVSASSSGVTGLTASTSADTFSNGADSIKFNVSGVPTSSGNASFSVTLGGQTCVYTLNVNLPFGLLGSLNCGSGVKTGSLIKGQSASAVSFSIPYTGGNGGLYSGQTISSTGITGLSASISADTFKNGSGNLIFSVSGTPTDIGNANFAINIGGKSCTFSFPVVLPIGTVTSISCDSGKLKYQEPFMATIPVNAVSYTLPYFGGNGGTYTSQTVNSTGVTGLTATLASGILKTGDSSVILNISGTPATSGVASFSVTLGGKSCVFSIPIANLLEGTITSLECADGRTSSILFEGVLANGASFTIPYNGGNRGYHNGQVINSTGVTGLTATLNKGQFAIGFGLVTYTITGTPTSTGIANFNLSIGGKMCTYSMNVRSSVGSISSLNCGLGTISTSILVGRLNSGISFTIPYTGGNGGLYSGQIVQSTDVTGLTATIAANYFNIGDGDLVFNLSGTSTKAGTAYFSLDMGGQRCIFPVKVSGGSSAISNSENELEVYKYENTIYINNHKEPLTYSIVDITGKNIKSGELKRTESQIDLSQNQISKGVIFLLIHDSKDSKSYKLSH